ncbi:hypothetical protein FRC04_002160 [Tulasnella sp. 424]|nr:hypothetical protein FRC04_002160 [Tulasnella sp. 424]
MSDDDPEWLSPQGGPLMLPAPVPEPPPFTRQTQEPLSEPTAQSPRAHSSESNTSSMIVIQSDFFRDMLNSTHLGCESEGTESNPIVLDTISQVTKFQVESFYRVIDHRAAKS